MYREIMVLMKMIKIIPLATSLVFTVLTPDVFAIKSQQDPSDTKPAAPAVKKRKSTQSSSVATNPDLFSPKPKSVTTPHHKRPRTALQRIIIVDQDDDDNDISSPASGSSTCDPADDQDVTTHEQRIGQILPLLTEEFRNPLYRNQIDEFVLEFESGRVFENILTALRRIDTEDRFYAINWVRGILNKYPHLKDSDEDEIIETLEVYDGSKIVVPATPPSSQSR